MSNTKFIFDGIKKISYRPINFINNRSLLNSTEKKEPIIIVFRDEKKVISDTLIETLTTEKVIGKELNISINDDIQYLSFDIFLSMLISSRFEGEAIFIENFSEQDIRKTYIPNILKSKNIKAKFFGKNLKYDIPIQYLDDLYLNVLFSENNKNKFYSFFPLHPYNTKLIYKESKIYSNALLNSGDISAFTINMKSIIALACMCNTIKNIEEIFTKNTDYKKFTGISDVHTIMNIYWDIEIFTFKNKQYNKLINASPMNYLEEWCIKYKMNLNVIQKFYQCYENVIQIFDSLFPIPIKIASLLYFPEYVFSIGVQQADDIRNRNATYHRGESKLFTNIGNYAANKFVVNFNFNRISAIPNNALKPFLPENVNEYNEYQNEMQKDAIEFVYFNNIRVPIF